MTKAFKPFLAYKTYSQTIGKLSGLLVISFQFTAALVKRFVVGKAIASDIFNQIGMKFSVFTLIDPKGLTEGVVISLPASWGLKKSVNLWD